MHFVIIELERWTVKLPTRVEFKNVTVRVLKSVPKPKPEEVELASASSPSHVEPTTPHILRDGELKPHVNKPRAPAKIEVYDSESEDEDDKSSVSHSLCPFPMPWEDKKDEMLVPQVILDNLNGVIEPGKMIAIMGASGAGRIDHVYTIIYTFISYIYKWTNHRMLPLIHIHTHTYYR